MPRWKVSKTLESVILESSVGVFGRGLLISQTDGFVTIPLRAIFNIKISSLYNVQVMTVPC